MKEMTCEPQSLALKRRLASRSRSLVEPGHVIPASSGSLGVLKVGFAARLV